MRSCKFGLSLLLACALGACGGSGSEPRLLELGTDVLVADIDGDGRADVVTLAYLYGDRNPEGRLTVHRQTTSGVFAAPQTYTVGCYPWSMTLADIDGDGRPDLVVTDVGARNCSDPSTGDAVHLLRQDASSPGRFMSPRTLISGVHSYQVAVADIDGDGVPDIVTGGLKSDHQQLVLLRQDARARGTFLPAVTVPMPGEVVELVAGDIDGDGRTDLFFHMYRASGSSLAVMLQLPGGGLGTVAALTTQTGLNVQRLAVMDLNGDGRADLIAHFQPQSTDFAPRLTALLQGTSPASWSAPVDTSLAGINWNAGTAFGDLNADGRPDVALAGSIGSGGPYGGDWHIDSRVHLLLASAAGSYRPVMDVGLPIGADRVAIGDVDGDGRNDIVLAGGSTEVAVMLQSRTSPGSFVEPRPLR